MGTDVTILNRLSENWAGITQPSVLVAGRPGARLIIGNNVGMSGAILYAVEEIVVEDFVNLGAGVRIYVNDHHPLTAQARRVHDEIRIPTAPVRICQDAFIGAEASILKGVTVEPKAAVAARAVVTRDVPTDAIVAGVPARVVGHVDNGF